MVAAGFAVALALLLLAGTLALLFRMPPLLAVIAAICVGIVW